MAEGDIVVEDGPNFNGNTTNVDDSEEVEPNFDDPEDFIDDITDEGN